MASNRNDMNVKKRKDSVPESSKTSLLNIAIYNILVDEVGSYLSNEDKAALSQSCKTLHRLFQPYLNKKAPTLLQYVAYGKQDKVKKVLEANPECLLIEDKVTDYSGRIFNTSPFKLALWYLDSHMYRMMLECIPENEKGIMLLEEMLRQYDVLEKEGLSYTFNGQQFNEKHYDFGPLIKALNTYLDFLHATHAGSQNQTIAKLWCEDVGTAQKFVPVHVANEYCTRAFDPTPTFKETVLKRSLDIYSWDNQIKDAWFPISPASGLGTKFAISGGITRARFCDISGSTTHDLKAMLTLSQVRTQEFSQFKKQLKQKFTQAMESFKSNRCSIQ